MSFNNALFPEQNTEMLLDRLLDLEEKQSSLLNLNRRLMEQKEQYMEENDRLKAEKQNLEEELMEQKRMVEWTTRKMWRAEEEKDDVRTILPLRMRTLEDEVVELHNRLQEKKIEFAQVIMVKERMLGMMTEEMEETKAEFEVIAELLDEKKEFSKWLMRCNERLKEELERLKEQHEEEEHYSNALKNRCDRLLEAAEEPREQLLIADYRLMEVTEVLEENRQAWERDVQDLQEKVWESEQSALRRRRCDR